MSRPTLPQISPLALVPLGLKESEQEALRELDEIPFSEILDCDSRPTFVVDLDSDWVVRDEIRPVFCNAALRLHDRLLDSVTGVEQHTVGQRPNNATYTEFRSWATGVSPFDDSRDGFPLTKLYFDLLWVGSTIRKRWRVISGSQCYDISRLPEGALHERSKKDSSNSSGQNSPMRYDPPTSIATVDAPSPDFTTASIAPISHVSFAPAPRRDMPFLVNTDKNSGSSTSRSGGSVSLAFKPEKGVVDWTAAEPRGSLTEHMAFARSIDWGATCLGPMSSWTPEFRELANLTMKNSHPCGLFWGEELILMYNEAYKIEAAGNKHPELMGTGFSGPFSETWDYLQPIFQECATTGRSARVDNHRIPIERYGYLEETFFSWSFNPMYGGTDRILGFYAGVFEVTAPNVRTRRLQTLRQLGESMAEARHVKDFWSHVLVVLEGNHFDIPFAMLYSIVDTDDADATSQASDSTISMKSCLLEGAIGIPDGHPSTPARLDLKRSHEGFIPAFREAMRTRVPTMLNTRNDTLPAELLEGIQWRADGDPCKEAIIIPVRPTTGESIFGFLLIGINPRRAYDDEYKAFISMLNRQLATSLAALLLFEDELRRNRSAAELAELQREKLSEQLALQASRMRRMTELSPLGMYLFSPDGALLEANDRFYQMTGHSREDEASFSFLEYMHGQSKTKCAAMWDGLIRDRKPLQEELQIKNPRTTPTDLSGEPIEFWVLANSVPELSPDGQIRSIMGSIADISHMKWAQGLRDQRLRDAEEMKRQQNEFIDITSHEMRNPLSAISICADDIRDSLTQHQFAETDAQVVRDCIEAADNITLCVQHQRLIVDDILTVSKLDSGLLKVTPIPVQPILVINRATSMFKAEVQVKDMELRFDPQRSLDELNVDWVNMDPSRILQITVNLITNAIKFTQNSETEKRITVHLGASTEQPVPHDGGFEYIPTRSAPVDPTTAADWGDGQPLYLLIEVEDTGCGLTEKEKRVLFGRFAQASARTHAQYGGSGLGLFISRQLAELHGGQIGVSSQAGVGSTFGYCVKVRRASAAARPAILGPAPTPSRSSQPVRNAMEPDRRAIPSPANIATKPPERATAPTPATNAVKPPAAPAANKADNEADLHILIVEDNLVNQKVLSRQLRKAGCTVYTADNGLLALGHLATTSFCNPTGTKLSVILCDLEMPEMDGLTCVGRIREMEKSGAITGHVPVIAVTANVREEQINDALRAGMDDVLRKPFRIPEVFAKIEKVLGALGRRQNE